MLGGKDGPFFHQGKREVRPHTLHELHFNSASKKGRVQDPTNRLTHYWDYPEERNRGDAVRLRDRILFQEQPTLRRRRAR